MKATKPLSILPPKTTRTYEKSTDGNGASIQVLSAIRGDNNEYR